MALSLMATTYSVELLSRFTLAKQSRLLLLLGGGGGTSAAQRQKFNTDDVKSDWNRVRSGD